MVIVAIFALGETLYLASRHTIIQASVMQMNGKAWMTRQDFKRSWKPWLRGTAIGFPLGVIPAGGSEVPTFLSYGVEKALSKNKDEFGKGAIEGVIGTPNLRNKNPITPTTNATCKSKVELLRAYAPNSAKVVIPAYR